MKSRFLFPLLALLAVMIVVAPVAAEVLTPPLPPVGPTQGVPDTTYFFSVSGMTCDDGVAGYAFNWGDGTSDNNMFHLYAATGTYPIIVQGVCMDGSYSEWSAPAYVNIVDETVTDPILSGPIEVMAGTAYEFEVSHSQSNDGHPVEYEINWSDGGDPWGPNEFRSHTWAIPAVYTVSAHARCADHPAIESGYAYMLVSVSANTETFTADPSTPIGSAAGAANVSYDYTTGDAVLDSGHTIEYMFDFGDGTFSAWGADTSTSHAWTAPGTYDVMSRARCAAHPVVESAWSAPLSVIIAGDTVSQPWAPEGPGAVLPGTTYDYTTGGSACTDGLGVEYRFSWGDGSASAWSAAATVGHAWVGVGTYAVTSQARCAVDTSIVSAWSVPITVTVADDVETITRPFIPAGPMLGVPATSYLYAAAGAATSTGHEIEYRFDWGDGLFSDWTAGAATHSWAAVASYDVRVQARCRDHRPDLDGNQPGAYSDWSDPLTVVVRAEEVTVPATPTGAVEGFASVNYIFETAGAESNDNHTLEYQFDLGGFLSPWSTSLEVTYGWASTGTYDVAVRARCRDHHDVESGWSGVHAITILAPEVVGTPLTPSGPATGVRFTSYAFTASGATSSAGDTLQYQFSWGDGTSSAWSLIAEQSHLWIDVGLFEVRVRARCADHPDIVSGWSAVLDVTQVYEEISTPNVDGPPSGLLGLPYTFTATGAVSNGGHPLVYQFLWGEGEGSTSTSEPTAVHTFTRSGSFQITVVARCLYAAEHLDAFGKSVASQPSPALTFVIPESVSRPAPPTGPTRGQVAAAYAFTAGGALSDGGHGLEYRFNWGDGVLSGWLADYANVPHSWGALGTYSVRVQARCATHTGSESEWSEGHGITITDPELVSQPFTPVGPTGGVVNTTYAFSVQGSASSWDHDVEYRFDWGDGTMSDWGTASRSHLWASSGSYDVAAQARCVDDESLAESAWSNPLTIVIAEPETVTTPAIPNGPVTGTIDVFYAFSAGGATSSDNHPLEYQFDWVGAGTETDFSLWTATLPQTHGWTAAGTYDVMVRARCAQHPDIVSGWSGALTVTIADVENVSRPFSPTGPIFGVPATTYTFVSGGASTSDAHPVEYRFDWGDGTISAWGADTQSHQWGAPGSYTVLSQARCVPHPESESAWSDSLSLTIEAETVSAPAIPSGPATGVTNTLYEYASGGSTSNGGHVIEYRFRWDGVYLSGWSTATTAAHGWPSGGAYTVEAQARCLLHPGVLSSWSGTLGVFINGPEVVSVPFIPTGRILGVTGTDYFYRAYGSTSSDGHPVEYQFDWGDGSLSGWGIASNQDVAHRFAMPSVLPFEIRTRARCIDHVEIESGWSAALLVTIDFEMIGTPDTPLVNDTEFYVSMPYTFTSTAVTSNDGHAVQYRFSWGDGTVSAWLDAPAAVHGWAAGGSYDVSVQARCADHPAVVSAISGTLTVTVVNAEAVHRPDVPDGPVAGAVGEALSFTTGNAWSNYGHTVEYGFDWGDGTTEWTATPSGSHSWAAPGEYQVVAMARCTVDTGVVALSWTALTVTVTGPEPETVGVPTPPEGAATAVIGGVRTFCTTAASSSQGHVMEYRFDWGDGSLSGWSTELCADHAWSAAGIYAVTVQARCAVDLVEGVFSDLVEVTVVTESVSIPATPGGLAAVAAGAWAEYRTGGTLSSGGHELEFQFDWGDGTVSAWSTSVIAAHAWGADGVYAVQVRARCFDHTGILSGWSNALSVRVGAGGGETMSLPGRPSGPATAIVGLPADFTTSGALSSLGEAVEYRFDWGDGNVSAWDDALTQAYSWASEGTFMVSVQARCTAHVITGPWSQDFQVTVSRERISLPQPPRGIVSVFTGVPFAFKTGGALTNSGDPVEYSFDWDEGAPSAWSADPVQSHAFSGPGKYRVRVLARCSVHTGVTTVERVWPNAELWSEPLVVYVEDDIPPETVGTPAVPMGITAGVLGGQYTFSVESVGATYSNEVIEYRFSRGDGSLSPWVEAPANEEPPSEVMSWLFPGIYQVRAQARLRDYLESESEWSSPLTVTITTERISAPAKPQGSTEGLMGQEYTFVVGGSFSSDGHAVEYRLHWGDGTMSDWYPADETDEIVHAWPTTGTFRVEAQARCAGHPAAMSEWSQSVQVVIGGPETVSTPFPPTGRTNGVTDTEYDYAATGAASSDGHVIEYRFDWGDGFYSDWGILDGADVPHAFPASGVYVVKVQARCADHHDIESNWSGSLTVTIIPETVSAPGAPVSEDDEFYIYMTYTFTAASPLSNDGHDLEYRFTWGDGTVSAWLSGPLAWHGWAAGGNYPVTIQARCAEHPAVLSIVSPPMTVTVLDAETLNPPDVPVGPNSGEVGEVLSYTSGNAWSNLGHEVEYRIVWGDGQAEGWDAFPSASHFWTAPGEYQVTAEARCVVHPTVTAVSKSNLTVIITGVGGETVAKPTAPRTDSPTIFVGASRTFCTTEAVSSQGHTVEYSFDWGDGTPVSPWNASLCADHAWSAASSYGVRVQARCAADTIVVSPLSDPLNVTIIDNPWGFLSDAVEADPSTSWDNTGDVPWSIDTVTSYFDGDALRTGAIGHGQESRLEATVAGPTTITFYWKVSSEKNADTLNLYLDGVLQGQISGSVAWKLRTVVIGAGTHTLAWVYRKDGTMDVGVDAGWVDLLTRDTQLLTGTLAITSANAGKIYTRGGTARVNWTETGTLGPAVAVQVLRRVSPTAPFTLYKKLKVLAVGTRTFVWRIPAVTPVGTSAYRFRVLSAARPAIRKDSGIFSIR